MAEIAGRVGLPGLSRGARLTWGFLREAPTIPTVIIGPARLCGYIRATASTPRPASASEAHWGRLYASVRLRQLPLY